MTSTLEVNWRNQAVSLIETQSTLQEYGPALGRHTVGGEHTAKVVHFGRVDEGRKRVIGIMAAILASLHMQSADDLFGGPQGSPRTDKLIAASIHRSLSR